MANEVHADTKAMITCLPLLPLHCTGANTNLSSTQQLLHWPHFESLAKFILIYENLTVLQGCGKSNYLKSIQPNFRQKSMSIEAIFCIESTFFPWHMEDIDHGEHIL